MKPTDPKFLDWVFAMATEDRGPAYVAKHCGIGVHEANMALRAAIGRVHARIYRTYQVAWAATPFGYKGPLWHAPTHILAALSTGSLAEVANIYAIGGRDLVDERFRVADAPSEYRQTLRAFITSVIKQATGSGLLARRELRVERRRPDLQMVSIRPRQRFRARAVSRLG